MSDGSLVSYCPGDNDPVAAANELAAKGLAVTKAAALDDTHAWDASKKMVVDVVPVQPPPPPIATGSITINGVTYKVALS